MFARMNGQKLIKLVMRDNIWLNNLFERVWQALFPDILKLNTVEVNFGTRAKRRLGSIRQANPKDKASRTSIIITSYFKDLTVPEYILECTLAHEICHYAHGFASPMPKHSKYPHFGGIVDRELIRRGLGDKIIAQRKWLKTEWPKIIGETGVVRIRRRRVNPRSNNLKKLIRMFGLLN